MKEKTLGIGLTLLSIAIWIGPIAAAFGTNGWSIRETIMPNEEEIKGIQRKIEDTIGEADLPEKNFNVSESSISEGEIALTMDIDPPFSFSIVISEFNIGLYDQQQEKRIGQIKMVEDTVTMNPNESKNIELRGVLKSEIQDYNQIPDHITFSETIIEFEAEGISIKLSLGEIHNNRNPTEV